MAGVKDETYDFVYSSHTLEHINDIYTALKNWIRILKKDKFLILYILIEISMRKKKNYLLILI